MKTILTEKNLMESILNEKELKHIVDKMGTKYPFVTQTVDGEVKYDGKTLIIGKVRYLHYFPALSNPTAEVSEFKSLEELRIEDYKLNRKVKAASTSQSFNSFSCQTFLTDPTSDTVTKGLLTCQSKSPRLSNNA